MKTESIKFVTEHNPKLYRLDLSRCLLQFAEFDFTYFWEQSIEAGKAGRKTGHFPKGPVSNAKNVISGVHPYIESCIAADFADIVTDCIIEYICRSERISEDELWERCISPKTPYEKAIFKRLCDYRSDRGINQWVNILRLQEYVKNKISFIYDRENGETVIPHGLLRARKEYFDLAVSVAANEIGSFSGGNSPLTAVLTPASLPNAAFVMTRVSKAVYRRFSENLEQAPDLHGSGRKSDSSVIDKMAMDAYGYVKGMSRPAENDMNFVVESVSENPEKAYLPNSFKAVIDLEFDLCMERGIAFRKCETCSRYFAVSDDDSSLYCNRVNSSAKTCREQYDQLCASIAAASGTASSEDHEAKADDSLRPIAPGKPVRGVPGQVPPELEKRGQRIYNALYKRVGKAMDDNEFREWSQYLSNMKRNIKLGDATAEQLSEFLDYSEKLSEEVKFAVRNRLSRKETTYSHFAAKFQEFGQDLDSYEREAGPDISPPRAPGQDESAAHNETVAKVVKNAEFDVKPFKFETFDSLDDALLADSKPAADQRRQPEIKMPVWERITREPPPDGNDRAAALQDAWEQISRRPHPARDGED